MTKLRSLVASLLLASPMLAAAHPIPAQKLVHRNLTASKKHRTRTVKLIWCDLHVCQERMQYVGIASYYGKGYWQGRKMANGERFDYRRETVALWYLPLGTMVRITNLDNGLTASAEVTDRGPAHNLHRIADLSQAVAEELGYAGKGTARVVIQPVYTYEPEYLDSNSYLVPPEMWDIEQTADNQVQ